MVSILFIAFFNIPRNSSIFHVLTLYDPIDPSLYLATHDESIPEFDETNSALDESKRSDESVSRVDETNSVAASLITTRRTGEFTRRTRWRRDK